MQLDLLLTTFTDFLTTMLNESWTTNIIGLLIFILLMYLLVSIVKSIKEVV